MSKAQSIDADGTSHACSQKSSVPRRKSDSAGMRSIEALRWTEVTQCLAHRRTGQSIDPIVADIEQKVEDGISCDEAIASREGGVQSSE